MNEWYDKYREGGVTDYVPADDEKGELEGLAPFLFVVAMLAVSFVLDCLW